MQTRSKKQKPVADKAPPAPPAPSAPPKRRVSKSADATPKPSAKSSKSTEQVVADKAGPEIQDLNESYCYELSEKEMKEINNAFDMNCSDGKEELLGSDDLKTAIRSLGFEPRADEIQKLIKKFGNKAGKTNRNSFHKIMAFKMGSSPGTNDKVLNDEISKVFNLLDLDKTGMITLSNLKSIAKDLNEEITDEELHEMIAEADLDGDSMINKLEFYEIMKKTSLY